MPTTTERSVDLPTGLRWLPAGEAIETAGSKAGSARLLANGRGTEIVYGELACGEHLTLVPAEDGHPASETYYILSGAATWSSPGGAMTLRKGDCLGVENLREPVILTVVEHLHFLYVTSSPTFHQISGSLRDLMDLAEQVEIADGYTAHHCRRLQRLAYATGVTLGLDAARLRALDHGAYLHDLGKIRVPASVLQKPGPLTGEEWALVKRHPIFGRELLEPTSLRHAAPIVEQHHERIDGSGYPYGLRGDEVLVEASIVAVADTYDAMTTDRVYRRALGRDAALGEIRRLAGTQLPRDVVRAFEPSVAEVERDA
jgi:hypothetical protein